MRTLIGLFGDKSEARANIEDMRRLGVDDGSIGVLAPEGAGDIGGPSLSPRNLPGLGRVRASGLMMTYLDRATATHATDAMTSALVSMGLPAEEAERYVAGVRQGSTLEAFTIDDDHVDEALELMREHAHAGHTPNLRSEERDERDEDDEEEILPVVIEELHVGKREIESGGVRVRSKVEEVPVEESVDLRRESVDVERRGVNRPIDPSEAPFQERTVEVIARSEEPVVSKEARVVEEVVVKKGTERRTETIRDTVRKTDVDVEKIPFKASEYEEHFQQRYGERGGEFQDYEPAYRFGHGYAGETGNTDWSAAEPDAKTRWEKQQPGTWDRFKDAIRHAWNRAKA